MQYDPLGRARVGASLKNFGIGVLGLAFIAGFLILLLGSTVSNISGRTQQLAQDEADHYLRKTGLADNQGATAICVGVDSDGDGYVSCPYVTKDGVTHPLECAGSMAINSGCRPPKAVFTQPQTYPIPH